jgi:integrase
MKVVEFLPKRLQRLAHEPALYDAGGDVSVKWYVFFCVTDPGTGRSVRMRLYQGLSGSQSAQGRYFNADKLIRELKEKLASGWNPLAGIVEVPQKLIKVTLEERFDEFLRLKDGQITNETASEYRSAFDKFTKWSEQKGFRTTALYRIDSLRAQEFRRHLLVDLQLSGSRTNFVLTTMRSFFRWMCESYGLKNNPFQQVKNVQAKSIPHKYLPRQVVQDIKEYLAHENPEFWLVLQFIYYCFIRPRELRCLRIQDIDLDRGIVVIPAHINYFGRLLRVSKNKLTQSVVIPNQFVKILMDLNLHQFEGSWFLFSKKFKPGPRLIGHNSMSREFASVRKAIALPNFYKMYGLKHTGAINAAKNNIPIKDLQMQLRHHSLEMVDRYIRQMTVGDSDALRTQYPDI